MISQNGRFNGRAQNFLRTVQQSPPAFADIHGSDDYPEIRGKVKFYQTRYGVIVLSEVYGLPTSDSPCQKGIFAFHIHSGVSCTGNTEDPFANAMTHYNPLNCEHPNHAGDLLPLWSNKGYSFQMFLTDRFSVNEIIGKTVIIHRNPDDFTTQPAGNAGTKIACGKIVR